MALPTDFVLEDIRRQRSEFTELGFDPIMAAGDSHAHLLTWARHYMSDGKREDLVKAAATLLVAIELMDRAE
jgi:hypothetical protein